MPRPMSNAYQTCSNHKTDPNSPLAKTLRTLTISSDHCFLLVLPLLSVVTEFFQIRRTDRPRFVSYDCSVSVTTDFKAGSGQIVPPFYFFLATTDNPETRIFSNSRHALIGLPGSVILNRRLDTFVLDTLAPLHESAGAFLRVKG